MTNTKQTHKKLPQACKISPKWRNFSKTGHTGYEYAVAQCIEISNYSERNYLLHVAADLQNSLNGQLSSVIC